ncbi:Fic family protein [Kitasatospora sp. NA04385]|uniref:Fic family protein n=1 Tax=Kitasatospora sp. NA04385 TaxID=2742135 RepID=UPI0020CB4060|nr:Fic family protein [Kitasatospora sp. NA04385]
MIRTLTPSDLSWDDVDPSRYPFDAAAVHQVVHSLGPASHVPHRVDLSSADRAMTSRRLDEGRAWADAMSHALVEHYGRWSVGWRWAHDEGDVGGGPVGSWCCPRDSITMPQETLARVASALSEWRAWLESLAGRFDAYPLDLSSVGEQRILWERAAHHLILQVTDRTGCGSGWHGHCRQVLTWFLTHWGVEPSVARTMVDQAIGGRFKSWTGPDVLLVEEVAERLSLSLRPDHGEWSDPPPARDHLQSWLTIRATAPWQKCPVSDSGPVTAARDGAADDIRTFDHALDPARAQGMLAALDLARTDAARGAALDFELLRGWQQHVLGTNQPPPFRSRPAFAKEGRERYGIGPDTRARMDSCLAESSPGLDDPLPITARAARAYLDVCFFHPFDDGNARAAFLAAVFVLAREGITLHSVPLLRRVSFEADDPRDGPTLAYYINMLIEETRRNSVPPQQGR